jgi:hypothetical protein
MTGSSNAPSETTSVGPGHPRTPQLTDWLAEPTGLRGFVASSRGRAKRLEKHELQQALLKQEAEREPVSTLLEDNRGALSELRSFLRMRTCTSCYQVDALVVIDRKGILLKGNSTRRCIHCLAWDQRENRMEAV